MINKNAISIKFISINNNVFIALKVLHKLYKTIYQWI